MVYNCFPLEELLIGYPQRPSSIQLYSAGDLLALGLTWVADISLQFQITFSEGKKRYTMNGREIDRDHFLSMIKRYVCHEDTDTFKSSKNFHEWSKHRVI